MIALNPLRKLLIAAALVAAPAASFGGIFISVGFAPPALPVYAQPICPGDGYYWTPGYWAYAPSGYYWVPGVWVQPPSVGLLWTPPYWGFAGGVYGFHEGYWGPHIGFYGGINYGFGYGGVGYEGGYWQGGHLFYNRSVNNINVTNIHNVYVHNVTVVNNNYAHTSFNGGANGIPTRPGPQELQAEHESHVAPTSIQQNHFQSAGQNRANFASANGGHPQTAAMQTPRGGFGGNAAATRPGAPANANRPAVVNGNRNGFGTANEVNTRQGNQQARVNQGIRSGQMTPGETRNVESRDASINRQVNADRAANNGRLTGQERQQINQRQNNVSRSIYTDRHNANNDAAAAARQNRAPQQERQAARQTERQEAPHGGGHPKR